METLTVHPQNKEQSKAIKAVLKALNIPFEKAGMPKSQNETTKESPSKDSPYNPEFVEKIMRSKKQIEKGEFTRVKIEDLDKLLGLE
ncbi:DUF2683 family protein [Membranihabitans maritimus]|uniref:DUF2683 family protein n=1 Tax=Membranihabitans maritimus TaxID=2904244 RepID=UPI001F1DAF6D|nr:DUF2683 family protein [Membranihabitans maritimus]